MSRITGRVEVSVNGNLLLNKSGAAASGIGISGEQAMELKEVLGDTGLHGFTETPIAAMLEVTVTDREDVSLSDLAKIRENGTIVFRAAGGGKSYTMEGATCTRNIKITAGEGETPLKFIGAFWTETKQ
jgi:hypothetical protein